MPTIIKKTRVEMRELSPTEQRQLRGGHCPETNEKKAELVLDNERVVALELTCSCGGRTVIALDYDDQPISQTPEEA